MAPRSLLMACSTSSRSMSMAACCSVILVRSSSAVRLTLPSRSRSALSRCSLRSTSASSGSSARAPAPRARGMPAARSPWCRAILRASSLRFCARGLEPCLVARAGLALGRMRGLDGAQRLLRLAMRRIGRGKRVGRSLPQALGLGQLGEELAALDLDLRRQIGQVGELRSASRLALVERRDLLVGALAARLPALAFRSQRGAAIAAHLPLALQARDQRAGVGGQRPRFGRRALGSPPAPLPGLRSRAWRPAPLPSRWPSAALPRARR